MFAGENDITGQIVDAAIKIHKELGPGLLESVYEAVLAYELNRRGLRVVRQQAVPIQYGPVDLDAGFGRSRLLADQGKARRSAVGAGLPRRPLLPSLL